MTQDLAGNPVDFKGPEGGERPEKQVLESLCGKIHWLQQVHEATILELPQTPHSVADGVITSHSNTPCAIRTADCLPVLFTNAEGTQVGAAHAGWRGLWAGILPAMAQRFEAPPQTLRAWIGPGIGQESYEVGADLYDRFRKSDPAFEVAFQAGKPGKYFANLAQIASIQLTQSGLRPEQITGGHWDTFSDKNLHSYRRDGQLSGRMVSVVWRE